MTWDYNKMEQYNMQHDKAITSLEQTYQELKEQFIVANIEFEKQAQALSVQIQDGKGKLEIVKVQLNKPNPIPLVKMHNRLKEFGEFSLDNTSLKMQNHGLWGTKVPNGKSGGKQFRSSQRSKSNKTWS